MQFILLLMLRLQNLNEEFVFTLLSCLTSSSYEILHTAVLPKCIRWYALMPYCSGCCFMAIKERKLVFWITFHPLPFLTSLTSLVEKSTILRQTPHLFGTSEFSAFMYFRKLREKFSQKILISFCVSLLALLIIFLAGVEKTSNEVGCQVVAALLHYFILTTFFWMGVEAVSIYQIAVEVFRQKRPKRFLLKSSLVAWGKWSVCLLHTLQYCVQYRIATCFITFKGFLVSGEVRFYLPLSESLEISSRLCQKILTHLHFPLWWTFQI